jgi:chromosome segregation ATPase
MNQELKDKGIEVQKLVSENQTLSTQLKDVKLSANLLKANSNSLQIKLDATLQQLGEKENQVESLLTDSSELKKTLDNAMMKL